MNTARKFAPLIAALAFGFAAGFISNGKRAPRQPDLNEIRELRINHPSARPESPRAETPLVVYRVTENGVTVWDRKEPTDTDNRQSWLLHLHGRTYHAVTR